MKNKIHLLTLIGLFACTASYSQISGNQIYGNADPYGNAASREMILQGDSAMIISGYVLLNTLADLYAVTLGLNEEAKTIKEGNEAINKRIESFKSSIASLGVTEKDMYVDFISQTKIYDYALSGNKAEQFESGFEIKKNIILTLANLSDVDRLLVKASENGIYDLVKVDYVIKDVSRIYNQMMTTASDVVKHKKETYQKVSSFELLPGSRVFSERFYASYPNARYKSYAAFESSDVRDESYKSSIVKKEERKNTTFYYDAISPSGFDAIINPSSPIVGVQYVLELKIRYNLKKTK